MPLSPFVQSTHLVSLVLLPLKVRSRLVSSRRHRLVSTIATQHHWPRQPRHGLHWILLPPPPRSPRHGVIPAHPPSLPAVPGWAARLSHPPGFLFCPGHRHKCVCICSYEPGPGQPVSRAKWLVGATTRTHTCTYSYVQYMNCRRSALPIFLGRRLDCFIMKPTPVPSPWVVAQTQNNKCLR